jgi:hypothetical protein
VKVLKLELTTGRGQSTFGMSHRSTGGWQSVLSGGQIYSGIGQIMAPDWQMIGSSHLNNGLQKVTAGAHLPPEQGGIVVVQS